MLKVYDKPCKNCLFSDDRIVPEEQVKEIIEGCNNPKNNKYHTHFTCHKASFKNEDVCCNIFFKKFKETNEKLQLVVQLNYFQFVPQDNEERLPSYKEMKR